METRTNSFERTYVARCVALAEKRGISHSELARSVWPDHGDPRKRWRNIRNDGARLCLVDAIILAEFFGFEFPTMCLMIERSL